MEYTMQMEVECGCGTEMVGEEVNKSGKRK